MTQEGIPNSAGVSIAAMLTMLDPSDAASLVEALRDKQECNCHDVSGKCGPCPVHANTGESTVTANDMLRLAQRTAEEVGGKFWKTHMLNTGLLKFIAKAEVALRDYESGKVGQ
jgi:hypothetical protein